MNIIYLNTSHVKVNLRENLHDHLTHNLNTSHVKVNLCYINLYRIIIFYLNTSHVKVNQTLKFKY